MDSLRDVDLSWLAIDAAGNLAVFTTAGEGPAPPSVLQFISTASAVVGRLPVVGGAELLVKYKRPDDFIAFAERGLYAYDWCDAHRTTSASTHCYELVAKPLHPISINDLPRDLRAPFEGTVIAGVSFGQSRISRDLIVA